MFVEVHTVGQDDWSTLPDGNGHTTQGTGQSFEDGLGDWAVIGAPVGSVANPNDWERVGILFEISAVVATQDTLRLTADRVEVEYDSGPEGGVRRLIATGNVLVDTGMETAAGDVAIYEIATAAHEMTGNVRLTQGTTRFEGPSLRADLEAGTGIMEGRVRTTFVPAGEGASP